VKNKQNIIIFGAGDFGQGIFKQYKKDYNVIYFCDNDKEKQGKKLFDIDVIAPENLRDIDFELLVIASSFGDEIDEQLRKNFKINPKKIKRLYVNESRMQFYSKDKLSKTEDFMFYICNLLDEYNISYHLDHGTLLGIMRDNALIPWDKDVDLAVLEKDKDKIIKMLNLELKKYMNLQNKQNKLEYNIAKHSNNNISEIQLYNNSPHIPDEISLDLMFKYEKDQNLLWTVCNHNFTIDTKICYPVKTIRYKNKLLKIPNRPDIYLEDIFGDWKTPVKNWTYKQYSNHN